MSTEGSVAPKERVNIVYKSQLNGMEENIELPLKMLVVGEFSTNEDSNSIEQRKKISINNSNFNDVIAGQNLNLTFCVPNKLTEKEENNELSISLNIKNIKDFEPDEIVTLIPELKEIIDLRNALRALKSPMGNIPEFRKKIDSIIQDKESKKILLEELGIKE